MATEVWVNIRAGVLVFGTRTHSTRVLNFWYSHCTNTREFQNDSTRTCTSWQVLRYSYEYWHEYWYSMVHLQCKCENHHTCEINSMTYHKGKFQIVLFCYNLNIWYMGCDYESIASFNFIIIENLTESLLSCLCLLLSFILVQSPHLTSG